MIAQIQLLDLVKRVFDLCGLVEIEKRGKRKRRNTGIAFNLIREESIKALYSTKKEFTGLASILCAEVKLVCLQAIGGIENFKGLLVRVKACQTAYRG